MLVLDRPHDHELKDRRNTPRPNPGATQIAGYEHIEEELKGVCAQIRRNEMRGVARTLPWRHARLRVVRPEPSETHCRSQSLAMAHPDREADPETAAI